MLIRQYGCPACHTMPGIRGANSLAGPPITGIAQRVYIAAVPENDLPNLIRWIRIPQDFDDETAMPNLGISETDDRHIAAYLYTLR